MAAPFLRNRAVRKTHPMLGLTEHRLDAANRIAVVINYSPHRVQEELSLARGWRRSMPAPRSLRGRPTGDRSGPVRAPTLIFSKANGRCAPS